MSFLSSKAGITITGRRGLSTVSDRLYTRRLPHDAYFENNRVHNYHSHVGRRNNRNVTTHFHTHHKTNHNHQNIRCISSTPMRLDGELAENCNQHVVSSPYPPLEDGSWNQPLPDFVMSHWMDHHKNDSLAILDGSTGMTRTFGEYARDTAGIAGSLRHDLGMDADACVCLFAPNHVDYLPVTLAVGLCGAKLTPVNPLYTTQELVVVLNKSKTSVVIAHTANVEVALEAAKQAKHVKHVLVMTEEGEVAPHGLDSLESIKRHDQAFDTTLPCAADSHPYLLPYSSGTTGLPKGVCLTHANLTVNLLQMEIVEGPRLTPGQGLFSPLPFFHIYGMVVSMMYYGWKQSPIYTMSGRFDFELMLQMIQDHQPVNAHLVPPIILGLAKSPLVDQYQISSIDTIVSAAAPLGSDTEGEVQNRLGCQVKQAWGMSELSPIGTFTPNSDVRVGSVGPLVSNTVGKILDAEGNSLGPHQEGELVIKGPQVMLGYLDEPEKTQDCKSSTGWLRTGDLAQYDEDGYFTITDRIKELIKVRGYPVAPAELEDLLLGHERVNDVAVIQIPDETNGELPLAYIVLKEGCSDDESTKQEIYEWVKERVAPYKRLDGGITFVESIPKSASGKILRRILRDELAEQREA